MAAAVQKAKRNDPVSETIQPVIKGAATPPRLPMKFWKPVQRPAAGGPASVWVMAQTLAAWISSRGTYTGM